MTMTSKSDIMVFFANAVDTTGEDGSRIRGCSVGYLFWGENGEMLAPVSEPDVTVPVGIQRGKAWLDYSARDKIRIAPAIYEGTFTMAPDSNGKPVFKLIDVAYKSNVKLEAYEVPGIYVPGMLNDHYMTGTQMPGIPSGSVATTVSMTGSKQESQKDKK